MLSRRNLLEVAIIAVPMALGGCGHGDARITTSIRGERPKVEFLTAYEIAREKSRLTNKPMLVVFKTRWCRFSREMLRDSFTSRPVVDSSREFVCLLVDAQQQPDLCEQLGTTNVYPTVLFVSPHGKLLYRAEGRRSSKQLVEHMNAALATTAARPRPARSLR